MRTRHWIKNLILLTSIIFSRNLFNQTMLLLVVEGIAVFCLLSSAIYVLNDIKDIEEDRNHPFKKNRMLPSGRIDVRSAWFFFGALSVFSISTSFAINMEFGLLAVAYYLLNIAYTYFLKKIVILDVFTIAAGFLLRVAAGSLAIKGNPSTWLLICTFLLALFLGFCDKRHELVILEANASYHLEPRNMYTTYFLDQIIAIVSASTIVSYLLYVQNISTIMQFEKGMMYTFPYAIYGIFRYLYLVHRKGKDVSPTDTLIMDTPLLLNLYLWIVTAILIIYPSM